MQIVTGNKIPSKAVKIYPNGVELFFGDSQNPNPLALIASGVVCPTYLLFSFDLTLQFSSSFVLL